MPLRYALRAWVGVIGFSTVFYWLAGVWTNYVNYRALATRDPSAAELYSDNCLVDAGFAAGALVCTVLLMVLLRQNKLEVRSGE